MNRKVGLAFLGLALSPIALATPLGVELSAVGTVLPALPVAGGGILAVAAASLIVGAKIARRKKQQDSEE